MKRYAAYIAILLIFVMGAGLLYKINPALANSNVVLGFVTLAVGSIALYIYIKQKVDAKRDAAKIILQEIRRAESIIGGHKENGSYQFKKKVIATNSWNKNIHYFVGDLDNDELDKISDLYSTGEYLDALIADISEITFRHEIESAKAIAAQRIVLPILPDGLAQNVPPQQLKMIPGLPPVWKGRLDIVSELEPIYHSTIVGKLKKIAGISY